MSALVDALKQKFRDPQEALKALGLDASLLSKEKSMTEKLPTRLAFFTLTRVARAVNSTLAMDAKIDYMPLFKDLTTKNFAEQKPKILAGLKAALKGKVIGLALDEEPHVGSISGILNTVEHNAAPEQVLDESVSGPQHRAMMAAAEGKSNLDIPKSIGEEFKQADKGKTYNDADPAANLGNYLKDKGVDEETIKGALDMMFKKTVDASGAEQPDLKRDDDPLKASKEKNPVGAGQDDFPKNMMTKDEMNAAVKAAVEAERANGRGIAEAREFVRPYVGELSHALAMDSAEAVLRQASKMLNIPNQEKINPDGLRAIIAMKPKLGARPTELGGSPEPRMGLDEAKRAKLGTMFPGIDAIGHGAI